MKRNCFTCENYFGLVEVKNNPHPPVVVCKRGYRMPDKRNNGTGCEDWKVGDYLGEVHTLDGKSCADCFNYEDVDSHD